MIRVGARGSFRQDAMTTVQTMLVRALALAALSGLALNLAACGGKTERPLTPPQVVVAPYDSSRGEVLFAVVPLVNESGTSAADMGAISDALVASLDEVRGIACLPLNRTIAAMRARNLRSVRSPAEARLLANTLGVDGLIVGSITAYDPYDPPKLGYALALFSRQADGGPMALDPFKLQAAFTDARPGGMPRYDNRPMATVSEHLDGANHEVQMLLRQHAQGRHDPDAALGWRRMLASMDLYTQFAAQHAVARLMETERLRLAQPTADAGSGSEP
jgi:hypothetical protein